MPKPEQSKLIDRQVVREWAGVAVTISVEQSADPVEWSSEHAENLVIVNLGGVTSRMEARLGRGNLYVGAPTLGELSVIPAGERFGGIYQARSARFADILFRPSGFAEIHRLEPYERLLPFRASLGVVDPFLYGCVVELAKLVEANDAQSNLFGESIAHALKLHMVRMHGYGPNRQVLNGALGLSPGQVSKVQKFVAEHLEEPLTLAKLASVANVPVHHLIAGFRQVLGTSPARYVLCQRMRHARWLLAHSAMTLAEIAYACGLSSQSHLTTAFRKETGLTPAAFRAQFSHVDLDNYR